MKYVALLLVIGLIVFNCTGCSIALQDKVRYPDEIYIPKVENLKTISGYVIDKETGEGIGGVVVSYKTSWTISSEDGHFQISLKTTDNPITLLFTCPSTTQEIFIDVEVSPNQEKYTIPNIEF
ncbi:hypothetical protein ACFL56_01620 [Candidatus Margulisiibacteriota bacterium]